MNRISAISHLRKGGTIQKEFIGKESYVGHLHILHISVSVIKDRIIARIEDNLMYKTYTVRMNTKQLRNYIKLHY